MPLANPPQTPTFCELLLSLQMCWDFVQLNQGKIKVEVQKFRFCEYRLNLHLSPPPGIKVPCFVNPANTVPIRDPGVFSARWWHFGTDLSALAPRVLLPSSEGSVTDTGAQLSSHSFAPSPENAEKNEGKRKKKKRWKNPLLIEKFSIFLIPPKSGKRNTFKTSN